MNGKTVHSRKQDVSLPAGGSRLSADKGVVLLSVIIILLTIAIVGATLAVYFASVDLSARAIYDQAQALYLAEAGVARAVYMLRNQAGKGGKLDASYGPVAFGAGSYTAEINFAQSLITATGTVHGIKKTVQLQYKKL